MNTLPARTILVALALSLAPGVSSAQTEGASQAPTCAIFRIQDLSASSEAREYEETITDSIAASFQVAGFNLVKAEGKDPGDQSSSNKPRAPLSESTAIAEATAANADIALTGYYVVQEDQIYVAVQVWDVAGTRLITGFQQRAHFNLAFYSALHDWIANMLPSIKPSENAQVGAAEQTPQEQPSPQPQPKPLPPPESSTIVQARGPTIVPAITFVSRDEGMEVSLAGDIRIGSIANGKLTWDPAGLPEGTTFRVQKKKPGYHDEWQTVRAAGEVSLSSLVKTHSMAVEGDWTFGQLVGLGSSFRYYPLPDTLFFSLSGYFFAQPPLSAAGSFVFHADTSLCFGGYVFFPASAYVRLGLSTGVGADFTFAAVGSYSDVYLNLLNWWVETRVLGPIIFLRQEWKFATGVGNNLLGIGWMSIQHIPPFTLGVMFEW